MVWSDRDIALVQRPARAATTSTSLRARRLEGVSHWVPAAGAGAVAERVVPADRSACGRGIRQARRAPEPLPHPVVDNHCHLDISAETAGRSTSQAPWPQQQHRSSLIVQIGYDLPGARRRGGDDVTTPSSPASRYHPTSHHSSRGRPLDDPLAKIETLTQRATIEVRAIEETRHDDFAARASRAKTTQVALTHQAHQPGQASRDDPRPISTTGTATTSCSTSSIEGARPRAARWSAASPAMLTYATDDVSTTAPPSRFAPAPQFIVQNADPLRDTLPVTSR